MASQACATVYLIQTSLVSSLMIDTKTVMNGIKSSFKRQERMRRMRVHYAIITGPQLSKFFNPRPQNRRILPGQSDRGRTLGDQNYPLTDGFLRLLCVVSDCREYTCTVPSWRANKIGPGTEPRLPGLSCDLRLAETT